MKLAPLSLVLASVCFFGGSHAMENQTSEQKVLAAQILMDECSDILTQKEFIFNISDEDPRGAQMLAQAGERRNRAIELIRCVLNDENATTKTQKDALQLGLELERI